MILLGTPAIDFLKAEAPFPTDTKAGQLFRTQQAIHGDWMNTQIFGELRDLQNLWGRRGVGFVGPLFVVHGVHL